MFFLKVVVSIMAIFSIVSGDVGDSDEEYIDTVMDLLLNGASVEIVPSSEDERVDQPVFEDGIWKCGSCDVIDENKLIYREVYDVDTNIVDVPNVMQIGLTLDDMRCVTISAEATSGVRAVSGACVGTRLTLAVTAASHFTVSVYGENITDEQ